MTGLSNRITQLFKIDYPIIQAGMIWTSGWKLASAVSNAGGLGIIGSGSMYPDVLKKHIQKCKAATVKPFGVNVPLLYPDIDKHIQIIIDEGVKIVFTSAGNPKTWTGVLKEKGITVVHVVSSSKFALKSEEAGCDAVVAEGFEAGGHNGREETTSMVLIPAVVKSVKVPVIAAGGIATGKQMLAFLDDHKGSSGIVYALSRKSCEEWAEHLSQHGFRAVAYHAGLSSEQRSQTQELFMAERGVIVCATIAFGMGIDKPDVRFVFHADLPSSLDAYYQEIGRAGRDGQPAAAHMVFGMGDIRLRRNFIEQNDADDTNKRREHRRLDALVNYCEAPSCRRMSLLSYFGEVSEPCGNCDICISPGETLDGTQDALKILDAVRATGQRFGGGYVIDVLVGRADERAANLGHTNSPAFGSGKHRTKTEWQPLVRQMAAAGFLTLDAGGFGGLSISDKGHQLLQGQGEFRYRKAEAKLTKKARRNEAMAAASSDPQSEALITRLKDLRRRLAGARRVPAYVVFSDRSLIDMAKRVPMTMQDFAEVHGVGDAKLKEFGAVFIREIAAVVNSAPAN